MLKPTTEHFTSHGLIYMMDHQFFITAPFTDEFCLITGNKCTHQCINSTITMSLKLKSIKCRSLSLSSGSSTNIPCMIGVHTISTLFEEEHKFLGSLITTHNRDSDIYNYMEDKIQTGLTNIDNSYIHKEYKLKVYVQYFLPSLRFHLTVNDISKTYCLLSEIC